MSSKVNSIHNAGVANANNPLTPPPVILNNTENDSYAPSLSPREFPMEGTLAPSNYVLSYPRPENPGEPPVFIQVDYNIEPATMTSYKTSSSSSYSSVDFILIIIVVAVVVVVVVVISIAIRCFQRKRPAFRNGTGSKHRQVPYGHHNHHHGGVPMATAVCVSDGGAASAGACSSAMGGGGDCGGGGF